MRLVTLHTGGLSYRVEAASQAGKELVKDHKMKGTTPKTVSGELLSLNQYVEITNKAFKTARGKQATK